MGVPHENSLEIILEIAEAVGDGKAVSLRAKIMVVDRDGFPGPDLSRIFEPPNEFFLFGVHTDDRIARTGEYLALGADIQKLSITVWMATRGDLFTMGTEH